MIRAERFFEMFQGLYQYTGVLGSLVNQPSMSRRKKAAATAKCRQLQTDIDEVVEHIIALPEE